VSERFKERVASKDASTVDLVMLLLMPVGIAVLLGIIGYLGAQF
jgi:hypothetical protein